MTKTIETRLEKLEAVAMEPVDVIWMVWPHDQPLPTWQDDDHVRLIQHVIVDSPMLYRLAETHDETDRDSTSKARSCGASDRH